MKDILHYFLKLNPLESLMIPTGARFWIGPPSIKLSITEPDQRRG